MYSYNKDLHLIPASNQKLVTTSAALEILGKDFRYKNEIKYSGKIVGSNLKGNLYIHSNGDPSIGKDYFRSRKRAFSRFDSIATYIKDSLGVKTIDGDIVLPNTLPVSSMYGKGWEVDDLSKYYAAPISNYSFNENLIKVLVKKKKIITDPSYDFNFNKVVDKNSRCELFKVGNSEDVDIVSDFKSSYRKYLTASKPRDLFKKVLIERLNLAGIEVKGSKVKGSKDRKHLYTFFSDRLDFYA